MKCATSLKVLILLAMSLAALGTLPRAPGPIPAHAATNARLEIWNPLVHSSNITDPTPANPSIFTVGSFFEARVNVTGAPPLGAFDLWINYNITVGPNVLQLAPGGAATGGGLFDQANIPSGCSIGFPANDIDAPPGYIHIALTLIASSSSPPGGCYTSSGTGTILTLTFQVVGIGAGSIDIMRGNGNGRTPTTLIGQSSSGGATVPFDSFNAYFRNKPGIPPTPSFTFQPIEPVLGDTVKFNATQSVDSDNPSAPNNGIGTEEPIVYDPDFSTAAHAVNTFAAGDIVILGSTPSIGTRLIRDSSILFVDTDNSGAWNSGETIVYSTDQGLVFSAVDLVLIGAKPSIGTPLKIDLKIAFVDTHTNNIWDNGYVWDFGDGSAPEPGNVTAHIFTAASNIKSAGIFPVKLVTYDVDDGLLMRSITLVQIAIGASHDVAVTLTLNKAQFNIGENVTVNVILTNRGNRPELVLLNSSYNANGATSIGVERNVDMSTVGGQKTFAYTISTSSLLPGAYTVTSRVTLLNQTDNTIIPNSSAACSPVVTDLCDAVGVKSFSVLRTQSNPGVPLLALVGGGVGAIAVIGAVVYLMRRRRKDEDT